MSTCASLLHKLSSCGFWPLCAEYSTLCVKTKSYFKDQPVYRCEVQEMRRLNTFFEIFYTLFYENKILGLCKKLRIS